MEKVQVDENLQVGGRSMSSAKKHQVAFHEADVKRHGAMVWSGIRHYSTRGVNIEGRSIEGRSIEARRRELAKRFPKEF